MCCGRPLDRGGVLLANPERPGLDAKSQDVGAAGCLSSLSFLGRRPHLGSGPSEQKQPRGRRWRRGPRPSPRPSGSLRLGADPHSASSSLSSVTGSVTSKGSPRPPAPALESTAPAAEKPLPLPRLGSQPENLTRPHGLPAGRSLSWSCGLGPRDWLPLGQSGVRAWPGLQTGPDGEEGLGLPRAGGAGGPAFKFAARAVPVPSPSCPRAVPEPSPCRPGARASCPLIEEAPMCPSLVEALAGGQPSGQLPPTPGDLKSFGPSWVTVGRPGAWRGPHAPQPPATLARRWPKGQRRLPGGRRAGADSGRCRRGGQWPGGLHPEG